jgi:hypothetical protein
MKVIKLYTLIHVLVNLFTLNYVFMYKINLKSTKSKYLKAYYTFPDTLPVNVFNSSTIFQDFQTIFLNLYLTRIQAKEVI